MKKLLALLLSLALCVGMLAGCNNSDNNSENLPSEPGDTADVNAPDDEHLGEESFKVGIVTYYVNSSFESSFNTAAIAKCEELGLEHESYDANKDMAAYQTCFENAISAGCDAIVCVPSDPSAMGPQCELCEESGVYMIVMGGAPDGWYSSVVTVENADKGRIKAELIAENCGDGSKVLMLLANLQQEGLVEMNDAAKEVFAEHNIEVVAEENPAADMSQAMTIMENWLAMGLEFDAIWCATDTVANGAISALEQEGIDFNDVYIVSEDGDELGLNLVKEGKLDATLSLNGLMYGTAGVELADQWRKGETPEKDVAVDIQVVTADNVDEYLAQLP